MQTKGASLADFPFIIFKVLPPHAEVVVEIGCGDGLMGAQYKRLNPFGRYYGVETDPHLAAIAKSHLDAVAAHICDLPLSASSANSANTDARVIDHGQSGNQVNTIQAEQDKTNQQHPHPSQGLVDCIVYRGDRCDDRNFNQSLLSELEYYRAWLKDDGVLIAHLPNLHHWQQFGQVLTGFRSPEPTNQANNKSNQQAKQKRPTKQAGFSQSTPQNPATSPAFNFLANPTNLHFYTLDSIRQVFAQAQLPSFEIQTEYVQQPPRSKPKI
jgi:hypothetical protein